MSGAGGDDARLALALADAAIDLAQRKGADPDLIRRFRRVATHVGNSVNGTQQDPDEVSPTSSGTKIAERTSR